MYNNFKKIFKILDKDQTKKFKVLVVLMFFAMFLETIGIGSIIPLISYFTNQNILLSNNILNEFFSSSDIPKENILSYILILIIFIFFIKNLYMGLYGWLESKFAYKVRYDLGAKLFDKYLNSSYLFHVENNSSNLTTKIVHETAVFGSALVHLSTLLTEILVILGIVIFLMILRPTETFIIITIGFVTSLIFYLTLKKIISNLGKKREIAQKLQMKSLQQGLGAIKDIIIYKVQENFSKIFHTDSTSMWKVNFKMYFLQKLPRIWFELTTITLITFIIFYLTSQNLETNAIMGTIGIFLISSIRIIPSINRIIISLQNINFSEPTFNSLLVDLNQETTKNLESSLQTGDNKIKFKKEIEFKNVFFTYPKSNKPILKNINFSIKKHEFVGIVGETGSGKSTLVDLLIGLIKPDSGSVSVDKKDINQEAYFWKKSLGYVPQNLYLLDDSIKKNIAFGYKENEISDLKIQSSINRSQLFKFISGLKNGLDTKVGERGIKISGGEKQRIAIARALYNDPEILVLDEATSALDLDTENRVLEILLNLKDKKTIIFITHRKSGLSICDRVFKIENNEIKST
jgi:ATP-binding cassette, subfamily B, bacterial PglK